MAFLVALTVASLPSNGHAQLRYLPPSEYGRINVRVPQAAQARLESLLGSDSFERLANFSKDSRYWIAGRPVGRLKVKVRDSEGRFGTELCTAALVANDKLLTNYHCIPGLPGLTPLEAHLELGYVTAKDTGRVRAYPVDIAPLEASQQLDYSIDRVGGEPGKEFGTVRLSPYPAHVRESLFMAEYPEGQPETLSRKDCRVVVLRDDLIIHSCETLGGSSGSPIFDDNTMQMVGLHFAGSADGNYGRKLTALLDKSPILRSLAASERANSSTSTAPTANAATVALASKPAGAAVFFQKVLLGVTPLRFQVAPAKQFSFELRKAGFRDENVVVQGNTMAVSRTVHLKALGGRPSPSPAVPAVSRAFNPARDQEMRARKAWAELDRETSGASEEMQSGSPPIDQQTIQDVEQSLKDVKGKQPQ